MTHENRVGLWELLQNPRLASLFMTTLRDLALELRTHSVATVVSYNPATQRVTVSVDQLQVINDNATKPSAANPNPQTTQDPDVLVDIPVAFPRTTTGSLEFPILPGTKGTLHVQDRSLESYLPLGQAHVPAARWTHNFADAIFEPTIFHDSAPLPPTDLTATVLEGAQFIKFGRGAVDFVLKGTTFHAAMSAWLGTVGTAAGVYIAAITVPPAPPNPALATPLINGTFLLAISQATIQLATTLPTWISKKVQTE